MSQIDVDVKSLREAFPEFASEQKYPDGYIKRFLTQATMYISRDNRVLRAEVRELGIQYMACHLMALSAVDGKGNATGNDGNIVVSSHVGSVSVSIQAPIARDSFEQWIQSTPYGKAYWALLRANNPTGVFWVGTPRAFGIR